MSNGWRAPNLELEMPKCKNCIYLEPDSYCSKCGEKVSEEDSCDWFDAEEFEPRRVKNKKKKRLED